MLISSEKSNYNFFYTLGSYTTRICVQSSLLLTFATNRFFGSLRVFLNMQIDYSLRNLECNYFQIILMVINTKITFRPNLEKYIHFNIVTLK